MKNRIVIALTFLLPLGLVAQNELVSPAFWKFTRITGEVKFSGLYNEHFIQRPYLFHQPDYLDDTAYSFLLSGGIQLNANSFIWHPEFLLLDIGVEYSPQQSKDNYVDYIPDQGEIRTLKKLDLKTTLLQKKVISLNSFFTLSQTYQNREFLSNIKTDATIWGATLFFRGKFLPFSVSYQKGDMVQEEIESGRLYTFDHTNIEARTSKSLFRNNRNELTYSHYEYKRTDKELYSVQNDLDEFVLTNEVYFDKKRNHRFHSLIVAADQKGYDTLQRIQATESLMFKLPAHFILSGDYVYHKIDRELQPFDQQSVKGMLRHKLYQSLHSGVFYEYIDARQPEFTQLDDRKGVDFMYEKKIFAQGHLSLAYRYLDQQQRKYGESQALQIFQEEYLLSSTVTVPLKRPYVDPASIVVRNASGILYQLNFDYFVISLGNNYLGIQRVPGGQIPDNSLVYIDYIATMPGSYQFSMTNEYWSAGVTLFKKLIGLYYSQGKQDYYDIRQTDFVTLNYYTQKIYGLRTEYKALSGGVEFDDNNSSVMPYKLQRYYLSLQGQFLKRFVYSVNGNYSDYHLILEDLYQTFKDVSGQLTYQVNAVSRINASLGYRKQIGQGIDLNLVNARLEFVSQFRQLYYTFGVQTFQREYIQDIDNYKGVYFRISRKF